LILNMVPEKDLFDCRDGDFTIKATYLTEDFKHYVAKIKSMTLKAKVAELEKFIGI
jgi:hypothetical protein